MVGSLRSAPGSPNPLEFKNPTLIGDLSLKNEKPDKDSDNLNLSLKFKVSQNDLIQGLAGIIPEKKGDEIPTGGMYQEKGFAYFNSKFSFNREKETVAPPDDDSREGPAAILGPLGIGMALVRRAMTGPELRKEFLLLDDGDKKFYVKFAPNLNATTDPAKGESAYKFNLIFIDGEKIYPNFFTGAVRMNTKTRLVKYLRASSKVEDGPTNTDDAMFGKGEAFTISLEEK